MRLFTTILLLILMNLAPAAPWFAGNPEAKIPACCRRSGNHHCVQNMAANSQDKPGFSTLRSKCPLYPKAALISGQSIQVLPSNSQIFYAAVVSHPAIHEQVESFYRICCIRSQQKRGPPVFIS